MRARTKPLSFWSFAEAVTFSIQSTIMVVIFCMQPLDPLYSYHHSGAFCEAEARDMFEVIAKGVEETHRQNIAHRDIKLENILLRADGSLVVGDYGLARGYTPGEQFHSPCGTLTYAAPELHENPSKMRVDPGNYYQYARFFTFLLRLFKVCSQYSTQLFLLRSCVICIVRNSHKYSYLKLFLEAADVFALGVVLYALAAARLPFNGTTDEQVVANIRIGKYDMPANISAPLRSLIQSTLAVNPKHRPSLAAILEHAWVKPDCVAVAISAPSVIGVKSAPKPLAYDVKNVSATLLEVASNASRHASKGSNKNTSTQKKKSSNVDKRRQSVFSVFCRSVASAFTPKLRGPTIH